VGQSGRDPEGVCFLHVPEGCRLRPRDTGWYASFGGLSSGAGDGVAYSDDAFRFWGATFDPTPLYRFNAVQGWLQGLGVAPAAVLQHVRGLQRRFLTGLEERQPERLPASSLVTSPDLEQQGHFLAFARPDAARLMDELRAAGVDTDVRGDRIRFGFAVYHEVADVDALLGRLASL
jgi:selenocysteine lyase/cysteine desulfurase